MIKLKLLYLYYCIPSLWIHELSHALISSLLFKRIIDIYVMIDKENLKLFGGSALNKPYRNKVEEFLICMAPLFSIITIFVLSFYHPFLYLIAFYQITTLFISLPSKGDFKVFHTCKMKTIGIPASNEKGEIWIQDCECGKKTKVIFDSKGSCKCIVGYDEN